MSNVNSIKNFIQLDDLDNIINDNNDYKDKFAYIFNIYNKMNNNTNNVKELKNNNEEHNNINIKQESKENKKEEEAIAKTSNKNTVIDCKLFEKTELNDKKISIKINNVEKIEGGIFGKNFSLYKIETEPFGWAVFRKFSDFENLRKLIIKQFPFF